MYQPTLKYQNGQKNGHRNGNGGGARPAVEDKLQPHNIEAEEAVLGALIVNPDAMITVATILKPDHFFIIKHGWIYESIASLYGRSEPADLVTLTEELTRQSRLEEIGGTAYLMHLMAGTPSSIHAEYYAGIVRRKATFRRIIDAADRIARIGYDDSRDEAEALNEAEEIMFRVSSQGNEANMLPIRDAMDMYFDRLEYIQQNQNKLVGLPTGLMDLDRLLGGLQRTDMITLAGRPGNGKTSLALHIARHAAMKFQKRVAIFSLEMSHQQLVERLLSAEMGVDSQRLRMGKIKEDEWPLLIQAANRVSAAAIFIDDTPAISAFDLRTSARRLYSKYGLDLLIVDYLQLMRGDSRSENRQQEISFISRGIKALARELNIPVLALSQLSRQVESRHSKKPQLSDLRESGSIEQDSDVVVFVYRRQDEDSPFVTDVDVAKHRSGPTGSFQLFFEKSTNTFKDLEVRRVEYEPMPDRSGGAQPIGQAVDQFVRTKKL